MPRVKKHPHAGLRGARRDFVKLVHDLVHGGGRNHREVFHDFLELAFCAIAKTTHPPDSTRAAELEARYMRLVEQRDQAYVRRMPELLGLLMRGLQEPCDFLGAVSGELGALSEGLGQFFTPFDLSLVLAEMTLQEDIAQLVAERGFITLDEPASGAGGMVLACAEVMRRRGLDPRVHLLVRATDLSVTAYQMTYVQLSCADIAASVFNANTLTLETFGSEITPAKLAFAQHHGAAYLRWLSGKVDEADTPGDGIPMFASGSPAPALERAEQTEINFDRKAS